MYNTPLYLYRSFNVYEEFAETANGWNLDFRQIDSGRFNTEVLQIVIGTTLLSRVTFSRAFEQRGSPPKGLITFGVPADSNQHFFWRGWEITGKNLLQFPIGSELYSISKPGFDIFTFSTSYEKLAESIDTFGFKELHDFIGTTELFSPAPQVYGLLRSHLLRIYRAFTGNASLRFNNLLMNEIEKETIRLLLLSLSSSQCIKHPRTLYLRHFALEKALSYLRQYPRQVISVSDLALLTHVSERTLELAFKERFATTPKSYLKSVRLNGVHRDLWNGDPISTKIVDVANHWGFWHMSQFAKDYHKFFGELPSETIRLHEIEKNI